MRAAVIGTGAMGRNHARVYAELDEVRLVAVADIDLALAEVTAAHFGAQAYDDYLTMLDAEKPDLVSVVVPTRDHLTVARDAIARGIHVLVEKPIASSVSEGEELIECANDCGVILTVGHIERFNPAVIELKRRLNLGELGTVFKIHARRLGPFPPRIRDVGVVIDLATHDLDLMNCLVGQPVQHIYAETERRIHTAHEDLLLGLLRFTNGTLGVLDINWLTPTKIRELIVTGEQGMFVVNYLTQELRFYENSFAETKWNHADDMVNGVSEGNMIRFRIDSREPLKEEIRSFLVSVEMGRAPEVSPWDGLQALSLAHKLIESSLTRQAIFLREGDWITERSPLSAAGMPVHSDDPLAILVQLGD